MAISGKNARVRLNDYSWLCGVKWSIKLEADGLDATCFESNGFAKWIAGIHQAEVTVSGLWEAGLHLTPPALIEGQVVRVVLYPDYVNTLGSNYIFMTLLLKDVTIETEVRDLVRFSFTAISTGPFSLEGVVVPDATAQTA